MRAEPSGFHRVVLKNASPHHYLRVRLLLEDEPPSLSAVELKTFIVSCLRGLHGEVGAALDVDVLKYDEEKRTALLRVPSRYRPQNQRFGEAVELPDPAGILPEPGLRLQSSAGVSFPSGADRKQP